MSFVGSTPIARYIHTTASANGKRVQALGGAKNHMLVLPDADLDAAADAAVSAAYGSAGPVRCMAISAVVAVGSVGDALVEKIRERAEKIKIGPGTDLTSQTGPLITAVHRDKVASWMLGAWLRRAPGRRRHRVHGRGVRGRPLDRPRSCSTGCR